jgi:hypothetical protein
MKRRLTEHGDSALWSAVGEILAELETTGEVSVNTNPDYVVAFVCRELVAKKLITKRALETDEGQSAPSPEDTTQPPRVAPTPRTFVEMKESDDLRSVISRALSVSPIDEAMLRRGVWSYVGAERHAGTPPGRVIMVLAGLMDTAAITPLIERQALTRRVILWCVESFFGHLGGDVVGRDGMALSDGPERKHAL